MCGTNQRHEIQEIQEIQAKLVVEELKENETEKARNEKTQGEQQRKHAFRAIMRVVCGTMRNPKI